jgi:hypothetical protein
MPMIPTRPLGRLGFLSAISGTIRVGADVTRFRTREGLREDYTTRASKAAITPHMTVPNCRG